EAIRLAEVGKRAAWAPVLSESSNSSAAAESSSNATRLIGDRGFPEATDWSLTSAFPRRTFSRVFEAANIQWLRTCCLQMWKPCVANPTSPPVIARLRD